MDAIDILTFGCAVLAGTGAIYWGLLLPTRRIGVIVAFLLCSAMMLEYSRTLISSGMGVTSVGYGSPWSYLTRGVVFLVLAAVNVLNLRLPKE